MGLTKLLSDHDFSILIMEDAYSYTEAWDNWDDNYLEDQLLVSF